MSNNTKRTALYFTSEDKLNQVIVIQSGFSDPQSNDPLYHVILEQIENEDTPLVTPMILTGAKIKETFDLDIDPDRFTSLSQTSSILTDSKGQLRAGDEAPQIILPKPKLLNRDGDEIIKGFE